MTGVALPYFFDFNYADGSPWLVGSWVTPGPNYVASDPCDIHGGRGRITVGSPNDLGQFNSRLWIEDSPVIDVSFQFDVSEVLPAINASALAGASDPRFYLWVQLEDDAEGTDRYELYYSPAEDGFLAAIRKWTTGGPGYTGEPYAEPVGGDPTRQDGYVLLNQIDTMQPMSLRIQEIGTVRRFKIWQGTEPTVWTITDTTAPMHSGPRYVDLYTFTWTNGNPQPYYYVDNVRVDNAISAVAVPYAEGFGEANGSGWPNWISPSPDNVDSNPIDVYQGRGRVQFGDMNVGPNYFSARLYTANASVYDVRFDFDFGEMANALSTDLYLLVTLSDLTLAGNANVAYYQFFYDKYVLTASIKQAGVDQVSEILGNIDMLQPVSVRILESGSGRQVKVWTAGTQEPTDWTLTGTSPAFVGPRFVNLDMNARYTGTPSVYFDNFGVNSSAAFVLVGETTHFRFWYDSTLGAQGAIDANQEMANIEDDLLNHFRWFGNTAPWSNGPAKVDVKYYNDSHSPQPIASGPLAWYEPSEHTIYLNWSEPTQDRELATLPRERAVLVHELVHHFQDMTFLGGYMRYQSFAEAHAAFLERQFRAVVDPGTLREGGYASYVGLFLNSDRPNWVTDSYTGDGLQFELAVGCQLLFLNWLRYQWGYSAAAITQSQSLVKWGTPQSVYAALTGDFLVDPSVKFFAELEQFFPVGTTVDTSAWPDIANPYPLSVPSHHGPGGALGGAIFGAANGLKSFRHPR